MVEYAGTLQRLIVSRTLWLIVAWPLAGCLWQLLVARRRLRAAQGALDTSRALATARIQGLGGIVLATTAVVGHGPFLWRLPPGGRLLEPIAQGARFEPLDAAMDLLLDERAMVACGLACTVALAAGIVLATRPESERGWRPWAWLQLALTGTLLSFLADGLVSVAMGWTLCGAAAAWLAGWREPGVGIGVATRMALAVSALVTALALLFWGLGGSWDDEGYVPDMQPRLVAVRVGSDAGPASLSMSGPVAAHVFVDESRGASLRVPFVRHPIAPGSHSFRVRTGDGEDDVAVAAVEVAPGDAIAIVPIGPTVSFHTMADELGLRVGAGRSTLRHSVEERMGPGGVAVVAGVLLALLGATAAFSAWVPPLSAPAALTAVAAGVSSSAVASFLLIRLEFLFPSARQTGVIVASVGTMIVLAGLWRALAYTGASRWQTFASSAPPGLTLVALGLGGTGPALEVMVGGGVVATSVHLVALVRGETSELPEDATQGESWLMRLALHLGELLVSMERWVVDAVARAMAACAKAAAWLVAHVDDHVVSFPGDRVAGGVERVALAVEPLLGVSIARVAWTILAALAGVGVLRALWPGG